MPTTIYHYTTIDNALKIFQSAQFWASDLRYSNDATETQFGRVEVLDRLAALAQNIRHVRHPVPPGDSPDSYWNGDDPEFFARILERIADEHRDLSREGGATPFGVAFSKDGDKLSQWRGYAGENGCAIGVDSRRLVADFPSFQLEKEFRPIGYGQSGIETAYERIKEYVVPAGRTSTSFDNEPNHESKSLNAAARALLSIKDEGFTEESEVRLLFSIPPSYRGEGYDSATDVGIPGFRVNATGLLVPYWVVPINLDAITEIRVSPGIHKVRNAAALRTYFANTFTNWYNPSVSPRISSSIIPFQ